MNALSAATAGQRLSLRQRFAHRLRAPGQFDRNATAQSTANPRVTIVRSASKVSKRQMMMLAVFTSNAPTVKVGRDDVDPI